MEVDDFCDKVGKVYKSKNMHSIWKDKHGKVVIVQHPNAPLIVWFVSFLLANLPMLSSYADLFEIIAFGSIFTWAWLEIVSGVNLFRRLLGIVVMAFIVLSQL